MLDELIRRSEKLFRELDKVEMFRSRYNMNPYPEISRIVPELYKLAEKIPEIQNPQTHEEVLQSELRRRLMGGAFILDTAFSDKRYDFDAVVAVYAIPREDLAALRPWLESNKEEVLDSIDRLFKNSDLDDFEMGLKLDIPHVNAGAGFLVGNEIDRYHKIIGELLQNLTSSGDYLRDISAAATSQDRSYFDPISKTLAIGIPAVASTGKDGILKIKERELITLYGHEGMGHALNAIISDTGELPFFQRQGNSGLVVSTAESVAQFYQRRIFEDLKDSPETQKKLNIKHKFDEIYQENLDTQLMQDYTLKLSQYAILILGDKNLGDPQDPETMKRKIELISEICIAPQYALGVIEGNRLQFDPEGNLNPEMVSELRYVANPVGRALEEFAKQGIHYDAQGRSLIDDTLLKGFWTPIGFVDNARVVAKGK